jgi:hypothetical protein
VLDIEDTMNRIFEEADSSGVVPLAAAYALARQRLAAAGADVH